MKQDINEKVDIPEGVEFSINNGMVTIKNSKNEVSKNLLHPKINISKKDNFILLSCAKSSKREKKLIGTFLAHLKHMIVGVTEGHVYKLKICSSHFPMSVTSNNNEISVKNFFGEKVPRILKIREGVTVKIDGDIITVESPNKELAGQTAASIEQLCKITKRDRRIFQDGIYLIVKAGKVIE